MKYLWTSVYVNDLEESVAFYQQIVGLAVARRFPTPNGEIAFLGEGETKLELLWDRSKTAVSHSQDISLGFLVPSVEEKIKELAALGITLCGGPIQPNPHTKFFFIHDPNGLLVQFVEQSV